MAAAAVPFAPLVPNRTTASCTLHTLAPPAQRRCRCHSAARAHAPAHVHNLGLDWHVQDWRRTSLTMMYSHALTSCCCFASQGRCSVAMHFFQTFPPHAFQRLSGMFFSCCRRTSDALGTTLITALFLQESRALLASTGRMSRAAPVRVHVCLLVLWCGFFFLRSRSQPWGARCSSRPDAAAPRRLRERAQLSNVRNACQGGERAAVLCSPCTLPSPGLAGGARGAMQRADRRGAVDSLPCPASPCARASLPLPTH